MRATIPELDAGCDTSSSAECRSSAALTSSTIAYPSDLVVVAEVEREELLASAVEIEREIRSRVVAGLGVAVRTIFLKPPTWIVKSTAGKAARSATREKMLKEHPELNVES